ncbi:MAG TPA: anti-sigma factor [Thermoanaerobaculia bacterium]|nr:anti-sigma factor [Thermoanaerobaculia bacterium]
MTHDDLADLAALDALGFSEPWPDAARLHLRDCEACTSQLRDMHEIGAMIGLTARPLTPPPESRARILASTAAMFEAVIGEEAAQEEKEERVRRSPIWWLASAASFFLALWGWTELRLHAAREQISTTETDRRVVGEDKLRLDQRSAELAETLELLSDRDCRLVEISGAAGAPGGSGKLFVAPSQKRALAFFHGLPVSTSNDCYQLWLIRRGQNKAESLANFRVLSVQPVRVALPAAAEMQSVETIAVTREPAGGSATPTAPMYLATKS